MESYQCSCGRTTSDPRGLCASCIDRYHKSRSSQHHRNSTSNPVAAPSSSSSSSSSSCFSSFSNSSSRSRHSSIAEISSRNSSLSSESGHYSNKSSHSSATPSRSSSLHREVPLGRVERTIAISQSSDQLTHLSNDLRRTSTIDAGSAGYMRDRSYSPMAAGFARLGRGSISGEGAFAPDERRRSQTSSRGNSVDLKSRLFDGPS